MKEESGIARAIKFVGTQTILAELLSDRTNEPIAQARVSAWLTNGYVPAKRAPLVAELTNVPLADLLRKTKRTRRSNGKASNSKQSRV